MCGIAGAIGFKTELHPNTLLGLSQSLAHRGPDDFGLWTSGDKNSPSVSLIHRRLAIQDLSAAGHQPMKSSCGRFILVFNGEIYNQHLLRKELEALGLHFSSSSDTEVLLALLSIYGEAAFARLQGMYAFCLWDNLEKKALLGRDPYGIKPLYYWNGPAGELLFASEVRSLLQSGLVPKELDVDGLVGFLVSGSIPEPYTLAKHIRSLPPGWMASWHAGRWDHQPHWKPSFKESSSLSYLDECSITRHALEESSQSHLLSDVPVGLFLSGGLDSSSILALTCTSQITALSIGFAEHEFDEASQAKALAQHFNVPHEVLYLDPKKAAELLPDFLNSVDQPSIDGFNTYSVSYLAARHGLKVVLSGLGGDELFGGYPSFEKIPKLLLLHKKLGLARPLVSRLLLQRCGHRQQRLADFLSGPGTVSRAHSCVRGLFSWPEAKSICRTWGLNSDVLEDHSVSFGLGDFKPESRNSDLQPANTIAWLESSRYMGQQLLRDSDVYSMAHGLELRIPFVDSVLFRKLSRIKASSRLAKNKKLLRDSMPELKRVLPSAPKKGFTVPFRLWLDQPSSPLRPGGLAYPLPTMPDGIDLTPWPRRWGLMVLRHWLDQNLNINL